MRKRNRYSIQIYDTEKRGTVSGKRCMSLKNCVRWAKDEERKRCGKDECHRHHLRFAIYDQRGDDDPKLMVEVAPYELQALGVRKRNDEEELYDLYR